MNAANERETAMSTLPGARLASANAGNIRVQPFTLPLSAALSPQAAQAQAAALAQGGGLPDFAGAKDEVGMLT